MVSVFNKGTARPYSPPETTKSNQSATTPTTSVGTSFGPFGAIGGSGAQMPARPGVTQSTVGNILPVTSPAAQGTFGAPSGSGAQMPARPGVTQSATPFGSLADRLPGDVTGSLAAAAKIPDASQALEQLGPASAMSSIPAGPGGGNVAGFAKGDNCGRPSDGGSSPTGVGEGASPGQKEFVPPESLKNDPEFQSKLAEMKAKYPGLTDQQIYNVIGGESGFNFKAVNGQSGATGAFQFIPSTASSLGYSTADIQNMSPAQQLGVYDKYLSSNGYKGGALGIMQAAPAYAGKPGGTEVYAVGSKAWAQNPGWRGSDGRITVDSINRYYGY